MCICKQMIIAGIILAIIGEWGYKKGKLNSRALVWFGLLLAVVATTKVFFFS